MLLYQHNFLSWSYERVSAAYSITLKVLFWTLASRWGWLN